MKKINKKLIIAISIIIFILIITSISILYIQDDMFFHPWHDEKSYEQLLSETDFEEISINNNGTLLNGWLKYNSKAEKAPLVIFFGGNAQNSSNTCMNFLKKDRYKYFGQYNVMIIDYPEYGLSEGKISDQTMFESALKIYDYAIDLECVDKNNIVILGYSIGTGVATYLASQRDVNGLILVSPYDEALSLYNDNFNIFHGPIKLLAKYKFKSIDYAKNVKVSPLIITSYADEIIDYNLTLNLSKCFEKVDNTIVLNDVKHNDYFAQEHVWMSIGDYLQHKLGM